MQMLSDKPTLTPFPAVGPDGGSGAVSSAAENSFCVDERDLMQDLTRGYGYNSISYFALDRAKRHFLSSSRRAFVSYVVYKRVAVVVGDPIGSEREIGRLLGEFLLFCRQQNWSVAFWQARRELLPVYAAHGLRSIKIGEEAIVDLDQFSLRGGAMAKVRSSTKQAEHRGVHLAFYHGSKPEEEYRVQMQQISRAWLVSKGGREMGFSMGIFEALESQEQLIVLAVDEAERVHAFVSFVPIYGRSGWGLDLMRRAADAAPGVMELLLTGSFTYLKQQQARVVSLGLVPQSNENQDQYSRLEKIAHALARRYSSIDNYQSLFAFKKKFKPAWESRYLIYPTWWQLPAIGRGLLHATNLTCPKE